MPVTVTKPTFVLDASVALSWCFPDETTEKSELLLEKLRQETALVPALWPIEISNTFISGLKSGRLSRTQEIAMRLFIQGLPISIDDMDPLYISNYLIPLAQLYSLTSYDMAYLELAMRFKLPLATYDKHLQEAARKAKVVII